MKTADQRLNNIIGQLEGARRMIKDEANDCFSCLIQLKAAKSAISSLMEKIFSEEFDRCLAKSKLSDREKIEKIFREILK